MLKASYQDVKTNDFAQADRRLLFGEREIRTLENLLEWFYPEIHHNLFFNAKADNRLNVLDIGCADKYLQKPIENRGFNYRGIDFDECNIEKECLPFESNSFDIIICLSLIEHISDPSLLLSEIKRVGKKGCILYILTPNWRFCIHDFYDDPTHVRPYSEKSMASMLRLCGFKCIKIFPSLRCKPKFFYNNPIKYQLAKMIPFLNVKSKLIPAFLKGKARAIISISVNP